MKRLMFLTLVSLSAAHAWVIEGLVNPHSGSSSTRVSLSYIINESYSGPARLKICLDKYDFNELNYDYDCDLLLREVNITMPEPGEEEFYLTAPSWLYRFCLKLYTDYSSSPYSDCDNDNTFFITYSEQAGQLPDQSMISLSVIAPEIVEQNESFNSYVNITNGFLVDKEVQVYSYAYNGSSLVSEGFLTDWKKTWTANYHLVQVPAKSSVMVLLINRVVEQGSFDFKVRVRYGDEVLDYKNRILSTDNKKALVNLTCLFYDEPLLKVCATNQGNAGAEVLLKLFADQSTIEQSFFVEPKRTVEKEFSLPGLMTVHALLLFNNSLVEQLSLSTNQSGQPPVVLTGAVSSNPAFFGTENVLYLITVTVCLISLYLLVRKM